MPETLGMREMLGPGTPAVLMLPGERAPSQHPGVIGQLREDVVVVDFGDIPPVELERAYVLVVGEQGGRTIMHVHCRAIQWRTVVFEVVGRPRPLEVRTNERYQADMDARLREHGHTESWSGTALNISAGGLAVLTSTVPVGNEVEIAFGVDDYATWTNCRKVGTSGAESNVIHLAYTNGIEAALLRRLLASIAARDEADRDAETRRQRQVS